MNAAQLAFYVAVSSAGVAFIIGAERAARRSTAVRWPVIAVIADAAFAMRRSAARAEG